MLNDDGPKYDLELSKKDEARRHGLWSLVAQKAKVMLDENGTPRAHVRTLKPKGEKKLPGPFCVFTSRVFGCGVNGLGWIQPEFWGRSQPLHCLVALLILGTE